MGLLVFLYISAWIVLLGAEFTRAYTDRTRGAPPPSGHGKKEVPEKTTPGGVGAKAR